MISGDNLQIHLKIQGIQQLYDSSLTLRGVGVWVWGSGFDVIFGIPGNGYYYLLKHFKAQNPKIKAIFDIYKSPLPVYCIRKRLYLADFKLTLT